MDRRTDGRTEIVNQHRALRMLAHAGRVTLRENDEQAMSLSIQRVSLLRNPENSGCTRRSLN